MSKRVNLTLKDGQYDVWQQWADKKDMSIHEFIKHCVKVCILAYEKKGS